MDVISIRDLEVERRYHKAKDVAIYKDAGWGSRLKMKSGEAAIFFPEDGHMPGQFETVSQLIRKTGMKVPV